MTQKRVTLTIRAAKEKTLEGIEKGLTVQSALDVAGRSYKTYEEWRRNDPDFKARADQAKILGKVQGKRNVEAGVRMPFEEWRLKYLGQKTFTHQLQWIDLLEGRTPRDLHPAQTFEPGSSRNRILINCPPFHAKSMTITIDYVTYRLCMDPSFRVIIISEGQRLAKDFLHGIKQRLTHPNYIELQKAYAPEGGWKSTAGAWAADRIYLDPTAGDGSEKDPNVQALGWRGQVYGSRTDMIITDDVVAHKNVRQWEEMLGWLKREVASRLEPTGKFLVVGTRVAPVDLYSELINPEHYASGKTPWTYLASPAILEEGQAEDGSDHVTLWPYSDKGWGSNVDDGDECVCGTIECREGILQEDGTRLYPRWDGRHIELIPRADNTPAEFALIYQQSAVGDNAVFPAHALAKCTNRQRIPGRLNANQVGHPVGGMHGLYIIGGVDPAVKGHAGIIVLALDKATGKRYILQAWNMRAPTPQELKNEMYRITEKYGVQEWRVEKTGLLQFFTQDADLRKHMAERGVLFKEHQTGTNKWAPEWGVAAMAPLFGVWDRQTGPHGETTSDWRPIVDPLIELPRAAGKNGLKVLIHQLTIWTPELDPSKTPCDLVMALWFAECGAKEQMKRGQGSNVIPFKSSKKYMSQRSASRRFQVVQGQAQ